MKITNVLITTFLALAAASCDRAGDAAGPGETGSRSTGERNDRLGNDPAQQNTGRGSTPEGEPRSTPQQ
jgi:hypothetical protein